MHVASCDSGEKLYTIEPIANIISVVHIKKNKRNGQIYILFPQQLKLDGYCPTFSKNVGSYLSKMTVVCFVPGLFVCELFVLWPCTLRTAEPSGNRQLKTRGGELGAASTWKVAANKHNGELQVQCKQQGGGMGQGGFEWGLGWEQQFWETLPAFSHPFKMPSN